MEKLKINPHKSPCEFNPVHSVASLVGANEGDCMNQADWSLGHNGKWHVCGDCEKHPFFKKLRVRKKLKKEGDKE